MSVTVVGFSPSQASKIRWHMPAEAAFATIFGAAVFAAVLWLPVVLFDPDTLWHITVGDAVLAHGTVPALDTYSFTMAGQPWMAHEWLSEVILALAFRIGGWNGLMALTAASAGATAGIVAFYVRRHMRIDIALALVLLTVSSGELSLLARPHMIALPALALWTTMMVSARARHSAPSLWVLPLMTLWANLHGGFLAGLVLAAAMAAEALFDPACRPADTIRSWGLFIVGAVLAAMIGPHGIDVLFFPFRLMAMHDLAFIQEWKPLNLGAIGGVSGSVLLALYLGLTGRFQLPRFRVLMVTALIFVTMQHVRYAQVFAVMAPLLIADSLRSARPAMRREWAIGGAVAALAVVSLCFRIGFPMAQPTEGNYAPAALASVPDDLRHKPVLNEYGFGGVLIFSGIRPFIDGRADLYGDTFMDVYLAVARGNGAKLDAVLCEYRIAWTIFSPDSAVSSLMDRTPGWHRLFTDKNAVIHVRDVPAGTAACTAPPTIRS